MRYGLATVCLLLVRRLLCLGLLLLLSKGFIELLQPVPVPGMGGRSLERILTAPLEVGDALLVQLREAGLAIIKGLVPRMLWTAAGRQTAEA